MTPKKKPERTCVITREKLLKTDLFRIVITKEGVVFVDDEKGKANGRGVYLKKDKDVILKAKKTHILDKHLEVSIPDSIYDELLKLIDGEN